MGRKSSKEAILDATERVIARQGLAAATIDAVAQEAGVSKGGLFYHFATKKDLLVQLMQRYERSFRELRQRFFESLPDTPSRLLKATILASVNHPARMQHSFSNLLTLLDDMELRNAILEMKHAIFREVCEGARHPEKVAIAMLVTDGLWLSEMFGNRGVDDDFKCKIFDELFHLIDIHEKDMAQDGAAPREFHGTVREG